MAKSIYKVLMRLSIFGVLITLLCSSLAHAQEAVLNSDANIIEDFEAQTVGKMPGNWMTWPGKRDRAGKVYHVRTEPNNRYLEAVDTEGIALPALKNFYWNIERYPLLTWRWRAKQIPKGASEADHKKNDSPCSVYVTVGYVSGHSMKYVWSSTLPKGEVVTQKDGDLKLKVLETGTAKLGKWQTVTVDVTKDHLALFGKKLNKQPRIAVMSDSNSLHLPSACDYDDFKLLPRVTSK